MQTIYHNKLKETLSSHTELKTCIAISSHTCLHHKMRWYTLHWEQFLPFSILISFHHSSMSWSLSHLPIGCCSRTPLFFFCFVFLDVSFHANSNLVFQSFRFWGLPVVYILFLTVCIYSAEVLWWLLTLTQILPFTTTVFCGLPGLPRVPELTSGFLYF